MKEQDWKIVINETSDTRAHLYMTLLKQNGLNPFITNNAMATMIPMPDSGYIIRVPELEFEEALHLLNEYKNSLDEKVEESFYDAEMEDIEYEKRLNEREQKISKARPIQLWVLLLILILIIMGMVFS